MAGLIIASILVANLISVGAQNGIRGKIISLSDKGLNQRILAWTVTRTIVLAVNIFISSVSSLLLTVFE